MDVKKFDTCKTQLTIIVYNFISSIDNDEEYVMLSKNDNIEIMINDEVDEVNNRYQNNLKSMKGSESIFDYAVLLYYKCYKINPNCGGSYTDSPDWIKTKKQQ